mgnify:CR=1 FL=1
MELKTSRNGSPGTASITFNRTAYGIENQDYQWQHEPVLSFNRTAYGIEKSVYVSPEKSIPTAFNRTAYGIENDE